MTINARAFTAFERTAHDRIAKTYAEHFAPLTSLALEVLLEAAQVAPGRRLLDVATGPGVAGAAAHARGATATGVDVSPGMIALAETAHPTITFRVAEVTALPFRILPEPLVQTFSQLRPDSDKPDDVQGIPLRIGAGFWLGGNSQPENLGRQIGHNPRAIGHPGAGGSIAWADPDKRLAVAICHNRMFLPPNTAQDPIRRAVTAAFGAD
jgi:CubicO group peptidase (beta-lactamase class C family)